MSKRAKAEAEEEESPASISMEEILDRTADFNEILKAAPADEIVGDEELPPPSGDDELDPQSPEVDEKPEREEKPDAEPAWFNELPEASRAEARRLHQTVEGQRRALKRRAESQASAELERKQAIEIAIALRRQMVTGNTEEGYEREGAPPPRAPTEDYLGVEVDDEGNARIPISKLQEVIARQASQQRAAEAQQADQVGATGRMANQILSNAGVTEATQQRFIGAIEFTRQQLHAAINETGKRPTTPAEERAMLAEMGADKELSRRFGGVRMVDVYDVWAGAMDPVNQGHRMVDVTSRYQDDWGGSEEGARPAARSRAPARIGEHPGPMARKGAAAPSARAKGETAADELLDVSMDDILTGGSYTPAKVRELFKKWESEK